MLYKLLSAVLLDQIDKIASLFLFNWLKSNYNRLATTDEFMKVKSCGFQDNLLMIANLLPVPYTYIFFASI